MNKWFRCNWQWFISVILVGYFATQFSGIQAELSKHEESNAQEITALKGQDILIFSKLDNISKELEITQKLMRNIDKQTQNKLDTIHTNQTYMLETQLKLEQIENAVKNNKDLIKDMKK